MFATHGGPAQQLQCCQCTVVIMAVTQLRPVAKADPIFFTAAPRNLAHSTPHICTAMPGSSPRVMLLVGLGVLFAATRACAHAPCPAGQEHREQSPTCVGCLSGSYKPSNGTHQCEQCPANTFGSGEGAEDVLRSGAKVAVRTATTNVLGDMISVCSRCCCCFRARTQAQHSCGADACVCTGPCAFP